MFHSQGGDHYMQRGTSYANKTIGIGLDITDLLSYVVPGEEARFFLQVMEQDPDFADDREVISYSIVDYTNGQEEVISTQVNIPIANSDTTRLWVSKVVDFEKVQVTTEELYTATSYQPCSFQLEAADGTPPYQWSF